MLAKGKKNRGASTRVVILFVVSCGLSALLGAMFQRGFTGSAQSETVSGKQTTILFENEKTPGQVAHIISVPGSIGEGVKSRRKKLRFEHPRDC